VWLGITIGVAIVVEGIVLIVRGRKTTKRITFDVDRNTKR